MGMLISGFSQLPGFKRFTLQDGLAGNLVRRIYQDKNGFIWIATWEGVSKYDGNRFTNFTRADGLSFSLVNDLYEAPDGKLFVALNNGSTQLIINDKVQKEEVFKNNTIERFVRMDSGEIIVLTGRMGVMKFNGSKLSPVSSPMMLADGSILPVADSLFLLSSPDNLTLHLLNSRFEIVGQYPAPVSVYSLVRDSDNRILAACANGLKIVTVDPQHHKIRLDTPQEFLQSSLLSSIMIHSILEDEQKNMWFGTREGLVLLEANGSIQKFTKAEGLPDDNIFCLFEDKDKNIWIGTAQGVARIGNPGRLKYWTSQDGLQTHQNGIVKKGHEYLLSSESGVQKIIQGSNQLISLSTPRKASFFLHKYRGSIISLSASEKGYISSVDFKNNRVKDSFAFTLPWTRNWYPLAVNDNGTIVMGTGNGLIGFYRGRLWMDTVITGLIYCVLLDDSILWVGTNSKGLYKIRLHDNDGVRLSGHERFAAMPDTMIRSIYKDSKGDLWVGTRYNGVYRISGLQSNTYEIEQFDKQRGLVSDWVRCIAEDKKHNIWVGTYSGVDKLIEEKKGWRIFNFSKLNNLSGVVNAILPDDETGRVWVGMDNGLASVADAGYDTLSPRPVHITRIQTSMDKFHSFLPAEQPTLTLPYSINAISFDFTSARYINENEMRYSYRLLGTGDTAWTVAAPQHSVSYASLQPGNYRFEAKVLGWNGEWSESAYYLFSVKPPFWKTWWFVACVISSFALLLYLLYRYRINQLKKVQQVRNGIASDLHDNIGSTLTNISLLTELSKRNSRQPEKAEAYLDRIREEIDASGEALDDIIWSVNTKNDTLQEIAARLRRYAAELFDARNIQYDLQMEPTIAGKKILMEQRRDLLLIFKEALNNIQKHASATSVSILLLLENERVRLLITDNGKGFDTNKPTDRNGISNIKARVKKWKGTIEIHSDDKTGTSINILMPISRVTQKRDKEA